MSAGTDAEQARRILLVIATARRAGAEKQLVRLACELQARGREVLVLFSMAGGPLTDQLDAAGVRWRVLRPGWPVTGTGAKVVSIIRLAWSMVASRPQVVYAWLPGSIWPALLLARWLTRARRVAALRGGPLGEELTWQAPLVRHAVRHAHCVAVNTPTLVQTAREWGASEGAVRVVPNGVDLPDAVAAVARQPPRAVVVAHLETYKGHDCLLDALSVVDHRLDVRICGTGRERTRLQQRILSEGLASRVVLVEDPADVPGELLRAQFAIHPSTTEGLSNAILEQLAHGLPVVATDVGGTSLLVRHQVNGLLVPSGDAPMLAEAIERLAADPALRARMSLEARAHADTFGWPGCADAHARILDDLVAEVR